MSGGVLFDHVLDVVRPQSFLETLLVEKKLHDPEKNRDVSTTLVHKPEPEPEPGVKPTQVLHLVLVSLEERFELFLDSGLHFS